MRDVEDQKMIVEEKKSKADNSQQTSCNVAHTRIVVCFFAILLAAGIALAVILPDLVRGEVDLRCRDLQNLDVVNHCLCRKTARGVVGNFTEIKLKAYDFYTSLLVNESLLDPSLIPSQDSCIEENQALLILSGFRVEAEVEVDSILQIYGLIMVYLRLDGPSWKDSQSWLAFDPGTSTCDWLGLE
jgi:hypothetical protein